MGASKRAFRTRLSPILTLGRSHKRRVLAASPIVNAMAEDTLAASKSTRFGASPIVTAMAEGQNMRFVEESTGAFRTRLPPILTL